MAARVPREDSAQLGPSRDERAETRPLPGPEPGPGAKKEPTERRAPSTRGLPFPASLPAGAGPRGATGGVFSSGGDPIATQGRGLQQDGEVRAQGDRPGGGRCVFRKAA